MKLTADQIEAFNINGFIIAPGALTDKDLQPVINELSDFIDQRARALQAEGKIENLYENASFETRYGLLFDQCPEMNRGMDIFHLRGKAMFAFLHNPKLLDIVESLLGSELTCNPIQHVRAKPPVIYEKKKVQAFTTSPGTKTQAS